MTFLPGCKLLSQFVQLSVSVSPFCLLRNFPSFLVPASLPDVGKGDTFTNRNFLYKCKCPSQKRNLCSLLRAYRVNRGSLALSPRCLGNQGKQFPITLRMGPISSVLIALRRGLINCSHSLERACMRGIMLCYAISWLSASCD